MFIDIVKIQQDQFISLCCQRYIYARKDLFALHADILCETG